MKKILSFILCSFAALNASVFLAACGSGKTEKGSRQETTGAPATQAPTQGAAASTAPAGEFVTETDLASLLAVQSPDNPFAGDWQITDGEGAQLEHFVYRFDGDKTDYIIIGTTGYVGAYSLTEENGKEVLITQLMFGLNGAYTYVFSDDNNTVTLTNTADNSTTTMKRLRDFSPVPAPSEAPQIDEKLLGAWADANGSYLYFDKSGVYFEEQKGISFFFYTYSAADGTITQTYTMTEETTDTYTYQVEGNTLTLNNYEYTRVSATEL